jgi:hypothetical protein
VNTWIVLLTSAKGHNGHWREWEGEATDFDDACEKAEAANKGWNTHTVGTKP